MNELVPAGWEMSKLGNVSEVFFSNVDKKTHLDEIPVLLCNYMDVYSNSYIRSGLKFMQATAEQREIDKFLLKKGDVIITKDSETPDDIAVATYVSEELDNVLCGYHLALIRTNKKQLDSGYLAHLFGLDEMQHYYYQLANGSTRFGLTTDAILESRIPIPPLPEQKDIAEALSDTDALIESLEQLIAKKRQIKQGAMQELLTGKKRLPGFSGEWMNIDAGSIGCFKGGNGFPTVYQGNLSGDYPFFKVSDMNNEGNETFMDTANNYISEATRMALGINVFPPKTIVFAKVGAAIFLERKKILTRPSCIDNNMSGYQLSQKHIDHRFIHFYLINFRLGSLVSTTALPSLNGSVLSKVKIFIPPSKAEQSAISNILSDMDAEINTLEVKLEKNHKLKQGMMQELLTGRIRLI